MEIQEQQNKETIEKEIFLIRHKKIILILYFSILFFVVYKVVNIEYRNFKIDAEKINWENSLKVNRLVVDEADIAQVVSTMTGIPVTKLQGSELERLANMKNWLGDRVIGQSEAVVKLTKAIQRSRAGLKSKKRPIGTFLFLGPTGVGKCVVGDTLITVRNKVTGEISKIPISQLSK